MSYYVRVRDKPRHPAITCARDSVLRASGGPADGASPPPPGQAHDGQDTHERASKWQWPQRATCDEYVGIMQSDGVQAHLGAVNSDMQGREALQKVIDSITAAADQLHALHGGVVQRAGGQRTQQAHRPTNRWYNRDCAQARHALMRAERLHGAGSPPLAEWHSTSAYTSRGPRFSSWVVRGGFWAHLTSGSGQWDCHPRTPQDPSSAGAERNEPSA